MPDIHLTLSPDEVFTIAFHLDQARRVACGFQDVPQVSKNIDDITRVERILQRIEWAEQIHPCGFFRRPAKD